MDIRFDLPAIVIVTDRGFKDYADGTRQAGRQIGPLALIRTEYAGDLGLIEHEADHVAQWVVTGLAGATLAALAAALVAAADFWFNAWVTFGLFGTHHLLYAIVPAYRLWAEVGAYKKQAMFYVDDRKPLFARFIAQRYRLKVSEAEVMDRLYEG